MCRLRQRIEDFVVEEIPKSAAPAVSGDYTIFWLEKFNWDTHRAIRALADSLHVSHKRFGIAGTKDRRAVTRQRVSVWRVEPEQLERVHISGLKLYNFSKAAERLNLGDLEGNRFTVVIRDIALSGEDIEQRLKAIFSELASGIPNIFGSQRFGEVRVITAEVGRAILRGDFEAAVKIYLTKVFENEPADAKIARNYLAQNWGTREAYIRALELFPQRLHAERAMLGYLVKTPMDFAGALRRLPKRLRKMFINAVQASIFNEVAVWCIAQQGLKQLAIPLVGYDTQLDVGNPLHKKIAEIMARDNLKLADFRLPRSPELATGGSARQLLMVPKNLSVIEIAKDELNPGRMRATITFELPAGSYATVLLAEICKHL